MASRSFPLWGTLLLGLAGCGDASQPSVGHASGRIDLAQSPAERIVSELHLSGLPFDPPIPKPRFVLTDTGGERFDFRARTDGFVTLLFFGYTHCPDVCPVHLAQLASVLQRAPEVRRRVKVVFVAVDPKRDSPSAVRRFLDRFDERFIGLVGSARALEEAQQAAGVPPAVVDEQWEGGYSVSHAGWVVVYTADNWARLRYPYGTRQIRWAHDLRVLVQRGWPPA